MKVSEQTQAIGGVEYELAVRDESTGYFGSWFCRACWKGGVKYDLLPKIDDALAEAELGAMVHHEAEHETLPESLTND